MSAPLWISLRQLSMPLSVPHSPSDSHRSPTARPGVSQLTRSSSSGQSAESWPCVWMFQAPPLDHDPTVPTLDRAVCPMRAMKLAGSDAASIATAVASASKDSVIVGFADGKMKSFPVPKKEGHPSQKSAATEALETFDSHEQLVTRLSVSKDGTWLVFASMDGSIRQSPLKAGGGKQTLQRVIHNPYNGGVVQVCMDTDSGLMLSTGGADGVVAWSHPDSGFKLPRPAAEREEIGRAHV